MPNIQLVTTLLFLDNRSAPLIKFVVYDIDESLFVYRTIDQHLKRTEVCRKDYRATFLGLIKPHKPVTSSTVSRWIADMIGQSDIDTVIFKFHWPRSAATSKASRIEISLIEIIKRIQWSSSSTFKRFYHKEIRNKDIFFLWKWASPILDRLFRLYEIKSGTT